MESKNPNFNMDSPGQREENSEDPEWLENLDWNEEYLLDCEERRLRLERKEALEERYEREDREIERKKDLDRQRKERLSPEEREAEEIAFIARRDKLEAIENKKVEEFIAQEIEKDKIRNVERKKIWDEAAKHGALPMGDSLSWSPDYPVSREDQCLPPLSAKDLEILKQMEEEYDKGEAGDAERERDREEIRLLFQENNNRACLKESSRSPWEIGEENQYLKEIIIYVHTKEYVQTYIYDVLDEIAYPKLYKKPPLRGILSIETEAEKNKILNWTNIENIEEFFQLLERYDQKQKVI